MKPAIDPSKCIACGTCAGTCPDVFKMNPSSGIAEVVEGADYEANDEKIKDAVSKCPTQAITYS